MTGKCWCECEERMVDPMMCGGCEDDDGAFGCATCNGTGLINPLTNQDAVLCLSTMDCPHCDGTGRF